MDQSKLFNEESGYVVVVVLMIMAIASIIGVMTIDQSNVEVEVASYDRIAKDHFYRAEGAAGQVAQLIETETPENLRGKGAQWMNDGTDDIDFEDPSEWTDEQTDPSNELNASYTSVDWGVAPGSSLLVTETSLHQFSVYGLSASARARKFIEMEYRRRF